MDLVNYAVMVFDFAPDAQAIQGVDMTNTSISMTQMNLKTSKLIYQQPNTTDTVIKNTIKSIKQVTEGWET